MRVRGGAARLGSSLSLALLLVACVDPGFAPGSAGTGDSGLGDASDHDGDGSQHPAAGGDDCDDLNPDTYPGADEICDGWDNDCDGSVDEDASDASAWYADEDGDDFGGGEGVLSCQAVQGHVNNGDDCDDEDADTNPDVGEVCDGDDDDCDGYIDESPEDGTVWYQDSDGDGYGGAISAVSCESLVGFLVIGGDCDDDDADINPDGAEVCDGVDNDCDGYVDDAAADASNWYLDLDGDGFGDADYEVNSCDQPSRYVSDSSDCDDDDADINPDGSEICDLVDEDCDDRVDEDASDVAVWYRDADGDGYGDSGSTKDECGQPSGYVADDSDCDDSSASVSPGAGEYCADLIDNDCDGTTDEDDAVDASTWYADSDGDGYGNASITDVACEAPARFVADDSDCDDLYDDTYPGAEETCDGDDQDCDAAVDEDASDADLWYLDGDGDGYGDPAAEERSCASLSGFVSDNTDCDDDDGSAYPGAEEICDGAQNDCDAAWSSDDGLATFFDAAGGSVDLSADLAGTSAAVASWTSSDAGDLALCGDWYVELLIESDLKVYGGDDADRASLSGGGQVSPVKISTDGLMVSLSNLELRDGAAELSFVPAADLGLSGSSAGGGLHCAGAVDLSLSDVLFADNVAWFGGGLSLQEGCDAQTSDLQFEANEALYGGGGIAIYDASLTLEGASFDQNIAALFGGGIYTDAGTILATGVNFSGNDPDDTYNLLGLDSDTWGVNADFECDVSTCD